MDLEKEFYEFNSLESLSEQAEQQRHEIVHNELAGALMDWAKGAIEGAEEVGRSAVNRAQNVPTAYLDPTDLEHNTTELTPEQQKAEDWYQKAIDTFNEETTKPLVNAMALSFIPGVQQAGWASSLWFLGKQMSENYEKEGIAGVGTSFLDLAPIIGSVRQAMDPNFQAYSQAHPLRAGALLLANEAPTLPGVVKIARKFRKSYLMDKLKKTPEEANRIVELESGRPVTAQDLSKDFEAKYEVSVDAEGRASVVEAVPFKKAKITNIEEHLDPLSIPEIFARVTDSIRNGLESIGIRTAKTIEYGAYEDIISPKVSSLKETVSINDIWKAASELNESVRPGIGKLKGIRGYFRPKTAEIRVGRIQNFGTLAHELGHYLDELFKLEGNESELVAAAKSHWKNGEYDKMEAATPGTWAGEGKALFMTEYIYNPELAQKHFPNYYKQFTEALEKNKEVSQKVENLAEKVRRYETQGAERRGRGTIQFAEDNADKVSIVDRIKNTFDALSNAWLDSNTFFKNAIKDFEEREGIRLALSENPAELAAAVRSNTSARAYMLAGLSKVGTQAAIRALEGVFNIPLKQVTLMDIYAYLSDLVTKQEIVDGVVVRDPAKFTSYLKKHGFKDMHEAFNVYVKALHELEVVKVKNGKRVEKLSKRLEVWEKKLEELQSIADKHKVIERFQKQMFELDLDSPELMKVRHDLDLYMSGLGEIPTQASVLKAMNRAQQYIDAIKKGIDDINAGKNDYVTTLSRKDNLDILTHAPEEFFKAAEMLKDYNSNLLDIAVHYGFIDAKTAQELKSAYPYYIPLQRDFSIEHNFMDLERIGDSKQHFANVSAFLKSLSEEGSERTVVDPMVSMFNMTRRLITNGERNNVGVAFAKLAEKENGSSLLVRVTQSLSSAKHIFSVWRNGKQEFYQAIAPGVYETIMEMDKPTAALMTNIFDRLFTTTATMLREGATSTPFFMMWNGMKDTFSASVYSKTGMKPILGTMQGFFKLLDADFTKKLSNYDPDLIARFEAQGVPFTTFIGSNKDLTKLFRRRSRPATGAEKFADIALAIPRWFQDLNQKVEMAPRLREYMKLEQMAREKGSDINEAGMIAAKGAKDLTTNFSQAGTFGKKINRYTTFFNATIQGNLKFIRAIKEKPLEVMGYAATFITLPTIALWGMNHDKDWYRDMNYKEKMTNWFIDLGNGNILRIPKPEMAGYVFASIPERFLDYIYDRDPEALRASNIGEFLMNQSFPNVIPTFFLPIAEWMANKSFFKNRPIESQQDIENKEYTDRYNIYTSELSKAASKVLSKTPLSIIEPSPMKLDNTFKDVTGSMGAFFLEVTNSILKDNATPTKDWRDKTRFTYNPEQGAKFNRTSEIFKEGWLRLKRERTKDKRSAAKYKGMSKAKRETEKLRSEYNKKVLNNPNLTGEQKEEKERILNAKINQKQREANRKYLNYRYIGR